MVCKKNEFAMNPELKYHSTVLKTILSEIELGTLSVAGNSNDGPGHNALACNHSAWAAYCNFGSVFSILPSLVTGHASSSNV